MEGLTQTFPAQHAVSTRLGGRLGGDYPVHSFILELHWSETILPCKFMDFKEIDGVVQSAMSLADPATLCLPHQRVIACLLPEQTTRILELGLGGGDLTRHLSQRWPDARHECVDLDEEVLTVYQQFFQHQAHDGQAVPTLHQADALAFLEQSEQQYDLILLDLFSQDGSLTGTLVINLLPRTELELTHALTLIEQWIGPATPYPVAGLINVIVHVIPRDQASSDL